MTEKTDIAALLEFNFDVFMYGIRRDAPFDGSTLADSISDDEVRRAESAFNSLLKRTEKAEQAASDLASQLMASRCAASRYEKELAELGGEQEPMAWALNDSPIDINHVVTLSEVVAKSWIDKGRSVTPLFTRQPKPVVVLSDCDIAAVSHMAHWYTEEQCEAWVAGVEHAKKQILAAGIVVKDGE